MLPQKKLPEEEKETKAYGPEMEKWLAAEGDIDDFVFYHQTGGTISSEK